MLFRANSSLVLNCGPTGSILCCVSAKVTTAIPSDPLRKVVPPSLDESGSQAANGP